MEPWLLMNQAFLDWLREIGVRIDSISHAEARALLERWTSERFSGDDELEAESWRWSSP